MKERLAILFRVNADVVLGLGHVSRCRSLMMALSSLAACRFAVMTDNRDVIHRALSDIEYDLYGVGEAIQGVRFDAVVVDLPDARGVNENFHGIADLVVCVDDSGPGLNDQDILIRPNLLSLPRPVGVPEDRYWTGQVILHPDFALLGPSPLPNEKTSGINELFMCFGGSDPCGITLRAVNALKCLGEDVLIRVVLGAAFPWEQKLSLLLVGDERFLAVRNIPDMAPVLRNADVALIGGGTLLYEACALGIPSIVICQNEEQRAEADPAGDAGAVVSLGTNANVSDENIFLAVERLLGDAALRQKMAGEGILLVAPDGVQHLSMKLLSCLRKRDVV